jgi:hypothetical protein
MNMNRNLKASLAVVAAIAILLMSAALGLSLGTTNTSAHAGAAIPGASATGSNGPASSVSAATCRAQSNVPLGSAANFRVLGGQTVTNIGATLVKGNLGVSPGSSVTGFPPGKVTGQIDKANTAAALAQTSLGIAYKDAFGRTNCPHSVAGNIGGQTLTPGLYKSTSSLSISSGDLTLTANGHSAGVFIFQISTKFVVTSGRQVILAGGAVANNIYWVVGSSATFGTTSVVYGNVLAHISISLATGAVLHGRALAHIGSVTLEGNTVSSLPSSAPSVWTLVPSPVVARPRL